MLQILAFLDKNFKRMNLFEFSFVVVYKKFISSFIVFKSKLSASSINGTIAGINFEIIIVFIIMLNV